MDEKTNERLMGILDSLAELEGRIAKIAEREQGFDEKQASLEESLEAIFARQRSLEDQLSRLERLLENISAAIKDADRLAAVVESLEKKLGELDLEKVSEAAESVSELSEKAVKKLSEKPKESPRAPFIAQDPKKSRKGKK